MIFRHGEVFINGKFERKDILVEDGFVKEISDTITGNENEVDCTGLRIVPGFFDIHTHGCLSYDFSKSVSPGNGLYKRGHGWSKRALRYERSFH